VSSPIKAKKENCNDGKWNRVYFECDQTSVWATRERGRFLDPALESKGGQRVWGVSFKQNGRQGERPKKKEKGGRVTGPGDQGEKLGGITRPHRVQKGSQTKKGSLEKEE